MSKWLGYAVSVNCGEPLGCYQGTILEADKNTITLTKAFRNGFPYPKSQVTLNAADIKDLKIIEEAKSDLSEQTHSTVPVTKNSKKSVRATVSDNLQANSTNPGSQLISSNVSRVGPGRGGAARSKPIDIQNNNRNRNNNYSGGSNLSSTPKGRGGLGPGPQQARARRRNEACFGDAAEAVIDDDFDFEGNLALFDKQALWEEMRGSAAGVRPDVVRAADEALRHDENVLPAAPAPPALRLPDRLRAPHHYTTDEGRRLPAATPRARQLFWQGMQRYGLLDSALVLEARAAADLALRLCGGGRRLEERNAHQAPVAVVVAAAHWGGAAGVATARLLASHGVRVHVLLSGAAGAGAGGASLQRELGALAMSGGAVCRDAAALPAPDVIVLALYDPVRDEGRTGHEAALRWAGGTRAAVLALEPAGGGWEGARARAALVGGLPAALDPSLGRVYLANVAPPLALFDELEVSYRPPFGAATLLPLN